MNHTPYRSNLAGMIPNKVNPEEVKRKGWQQDGILVITDNDHRLNWPEREFINQIGTKLYGNRKKENPHEK